jgi:hypothetical protein
MTLKTKKNAEPVITDDFFYDLFDGGYIKPDKLLKEKSTEKVREAIATIEEFRQLLEDEDLIEFS